MNENDSESYQIVRESGKSSDPDFFRFLVENSKDVIFHLRLKPTRGFEYVSSSILGFLGYSPEEFYADSDRFLKCVHPDDAHQVLEARNNYRLYTQPMKLRLFKKDGTLCWCELLGQIICYKETSEIAYQGIIRDITQIISGQEAILSRNRELQTFYRFSEIVAQAESSEEVYFMIAEEIRRYAGFPIVTLGLHDLENDRLQFKGWTGIRWPVDKPVSYALEETFGGRVLLSGEAIRFTDAPDAPEYRTEFISENRIQSYVGFPMLLNQKLIGVLSLADTAVHPVEERFMEWGQSVANMAASFIERKRVEQALVESERKYGAIYNHSHAPMILFDPITLDIYSVNPAACQFYGYAEEEFSRMNVTDFNVSSREEILENVKEKKRGRTTPSRYVNRLADGRLRTVEVFSGPIEISGRHLFFTIIHDITEEEIAETALRESERRYRDLAESMPFIIWRSDMDGSIDYYNKKWYEFSGKSPEERKNRSELESIHPEDREMVERCWINGNLTKTPYSLEYRLLSKEGDYRWFHGSLTPILNSDGEILRWYGSALDVTSQKEAQEAIRQGERRFRMIFEQAEAGIAHLNLEMRCILVNRKLCEMTGFDQEEMLDIRFPELLYLASAESEEEDRIAARRLLSGEIEARSSERRIIRKDSRTIWILETLSVARDDEDRPLYFIAILQDITNRKLIETALEESNRQLNEALDELRLTQKRIIQQERLRALGQMASGIAHDFNNSLMPIVGFSELLLHRKDYLADEEKASRYLSLILSGAQGAARTVNRLREFYRKPGDSFQRVPVDLKRMVMQAIDFTEPKWKNEARAKDRSINIKTQLSDGIVILGDESDLKEALINLIFNAVDAMPRGGVLDIKTRQVDDEAILEVSDTGIGMNEETREKCLEPFFTTKEERGTGLGLAMVHGIVTRHGGKIEIKSAEGAGATFRLRFSTNASTTEGRTIAPAREAEMKPLRILLAEDDPSIRDYLQERLSLEHHQVTTAYDGRMGWDLYQSGAFDIVITDYSMPIMSGEELAKRVKESDPKLPTLMLTGFGEMMIGKDEIPPGVDAVIGKPVLFEDLKAGIASLLSRSQSEEGGEE